MVTVGQKVTGKFQAGKGGRGSRTEWIFYQGEVTEVTEDGFKVQYADLGKIQWPYKHSAFGASVFERGSRVMYNQENADYEDEKERLGIED